MRKNIAVVSSLTTLALVVSLSGLTPVLSVAGDGKCTMSSASKTSGGSCCATGKKAELTSMDGAHCTMTSGVSHASCCPFDKGAIQSAAPGTQYDFSMSNNGATLTISAASAKYVSTVQSLASAGYEKMKSQLATEKAACPTTSSASVVSKAGLSTKSGGSCCTGDKAMAMKTSGGACPMHASASSSASNSAMTGAGLTEGAMCDEFLKGMCCSDTRLEKTASGVRISWTSVKPEVVKSVQMAAAHMKSCITSSGL